MKRILAAAVAALVLGVGSAANASEAVELPTQNWSFGGVFGTFDRGATQRGLLVYKEVCSGCHSLNLLAYRNLTQIGLTPEQVDAVAAGFEVQDGPNEEGDMFTRPARASDTFVSPFPNPQAARAANNGALPPDLSLITKARVGGADYLYALLTGYQDPPPEGVTLMPGMNYNRYFPGHQIGMAPPIADGIIDYPDGTAATTDQIAKDVTTFLSWAAEPELEERKNLGIRTLLFVVVLTALLYALKRKIWQDVH